MASTSVGSNAIVLEVLNQHNYEDWSSLVETYLLAYDLWDVVKQTPPNAGYAGYKDWKRKDARALHAIKISCGTEMLSLIRKSEGAKEAWNVLKRKFKKHELGKKVPDSTPLHKAAMEGDVDKVKELLSSMSDEESQSREGRNCLITALDGAIVASSAKAPARWIQIARAMVEKNPEIVTISSCPGEYIPVVRACSFSKWEMAWYLYLLTPGKALLDEDKKNDKKEEDKKNEDKKNGNQGALLISKCIWRPQGLDVAWDVIRRYPKLALADSRYEKQPMLELAGISSVYPSGAGLTLWQNLIYKG